MNDGQSKKYIKQLSLCIVKRKLKFVKKNHLKMNEKRRRWKRNGKNSTFCKGNTKAQKNNIEMKCVVLSQ